ncbi:unnamed protein product [Discosporangium mesarthrocarpum]
MLLETSFLGQVVDRVETQLLALTQDLTEEEKGSEQQQPPQKGGVRVGGEGRRLPRRGIFNEDAVLVEKRAFLTMRLRRISAALGKIDDIAPDILATSRRRGAGDKGAASLSEGVGSGGMPGVGGGGHGRGASPPAALTRDMPPGGGDHVRSFKMDPQVYAGSVPEQRAKDANDGSLAHFIYTKDGDNGGLVYWLGTKRHKKKFENPHEQGLLWVTSSGLKDGAESTLVSRKRLPCSTTDKPDSWFCVDVGKNQSMEVSHYSLCHGSPESNCDLVNWVCEGYDSSIKMWVILLQDVRESASRLPSPYGVGTWKVNSMGSAYRFLRLRSTGINGRAGHALPICAIELYGKLFAHPEM